MNEIRFLKQAGIRLGQKSSFLQGEVFIETDPQVAKNFWADVVSEIPIPSLEVVLKRLEREQFVSAFQRTLEQERIHTEEPIKPTVYDVRVLDVRRTVEVLGRTKSLDVAEAYFQSREKLFRWRRHHAFDEILYHYFPHQQSVEIIPDLRHLVQQDYTQSHKSFLKKFTDEKYYEKIPKGRRKGKRGFQNYSSLLDQILGFHTKNQEQFVPVCNALEDVSRVMTVYYQIFPESGVSCEALSTFIRENHALYLGKNTLQTLQLFSALVLDAFQKEKNVSLVDLGVSFKSIFSEDLVRNKELLFFIREAHIQSKESLTDIALEQSSLLAKKGVAVIRDVYREMNKAKGAGLSWRDISRQVLLFEGASQYSVCSELTQTFNRFDKKEDEFIRKELFQALYTGALSAISRGIAKRLEEQRKKGLHRTLRSQLGLENWLALLQQDDSMGINLSGEGLFFRNIEHVLLAQTIQVPSRYSSVLSQAEIVEVVSRRYISDPVWKESLQAALASSARDLFVEGNETLLHKGLGSLLALSAYTSSVQEFEDLCNLGKNFERNTQSYFYNFSFMYLHHGGNKEKIKDLCYLSSLHASSIASFLENKYYRFHKETVHTDPITWEKKRVYEEKIGFSDFPALVQSFLSFHPKSAKDMQLAESGLKQIYDITRRFHLLEESSDLTCEKYAHMVSQGMDTWL